MEQINNDLFYTRLPVNEISLSELLTEEHLFFSIPANWWVVVTDIKNSTTAFDSGMHQTVNLVATGSIVAVLNIAFKAGIAVPFFFGGDGASFILPPSLLDTSMKALLLHRQHTAQNLGLELRVGKVAVSELHNEGHELNICKFKFSASFSIPVLLGNGISWAEKIIKAKDIDFESMPASDTLDLSGMQCRWDKIKPPANGYEVVSLLVITKDIEKQAGTFKKVIDLLDQIYGAPQKRGPISVAKLKLKTTLSRIRMEMQVKLGGFRLVYLLREWLKMQAGYFFFLTPKGKFYLKALVDMSDTLVIDGRISTVISGTPQQRILLQEALNQVEVTGELLYGLHVSTESVISCYVRNMNDKHVHFVDGAEGGYTRAAEMLKKKIRNS